jgi:hypothetical protein
MHTKSFPNLAPRLQVALLTFSAALGICDASRASPLGEGKNIVTLAYGETPIYQKQTYGRAVVLEVQLDDYPGDPSLATVLLTLNGETYPLQWLEGKRVFDLTGPLGGISDVRSFLTGTWIIEIIGASSSVSTFTFNAQPLTNGDIYTRARNLSAGPDAGNGDAFFTWLPPLAGPPTPDFISCFLDPVESTKLDRYSVDLPAGTTSWDPDECLGAAMWDMRVEYLKVTPLALFTPLTVVSGSIVWSNHDWMPPGYPATGPAVCTLSQTPILFSSDGSACGLLGDIDGDGSVGAADLSLLLAAWGTSGAADLDEDGDVGASDLSLLLANWG